MKQYLILTVLLCMLAGVSRATHVGGTVTSAATGNPVAGMKVYVADTNGYYDSSVTNASGVFYDSLTGPKYPPTASRVTVSVTSCGATVTNAYIFGGGNITSNFLVCRSVVSGTVTTAGSGTPLAGQKVLIRDGLGFRDSAFTNASGAYIDSLPSLPVIDSMIITTLACGVTYMNTPVYAGASFTSNFVVCPSALQLHGSIFLNGSLNSGAAIVYLIRKQYDTTMKDTVLTAIDSIATTGGTYTKSYTAIPSGTLLIKAALRPSNASYASYLPTYDTMALVWSNARPLTASHFSTGVTTNFNMTPGVNPGGTGFLSGSVLVGANKGSSIGDPLANRILILTTSAGQAVAYTYSDVSGHFSFPNIAFGTYKIYGDAWGKTNPALTLTITSYKPGLGDIVFEENDKTFAGRLGILAVAASNALQNLSVYPNPVTDQVRVSGLDAISGSKRILLMELNGAVVSDQLFGNGESVSIPTSNLAPGVYFLQINTEQGRVVFKVVK